MDKFIKICLLILMPTLIIVTIDSYIKHRRFIKKHDAFMIEAWKSSAKIDSMQTELSKQFRQTDSMFNQK